MQAKNRSRTPRFNFSDIHFAKLELTRLLRLQNGKKKCLRYFYAFKVVVGWVIAMRITIHLLQIEVILSEFKLETADFSENFQAFLENYGKEENSFECGFTF